MYFTQCTIRTFNPNWHELWKQEKCSSLGAPRGTFYKAQWARQSVKLTRLMSIFTSKKVWKFLIQIQLTKSNPKITRLEKLPCLMPIRVNTHHVLALNQEFSSGNRLFCAKILNKANLELKSKWLECRCDEKKLLRIVLLQQKLEFLVIMWIDEIVNATLKNIWVHCTS